MQNSCDLLIKNGTVVIPKVGILNINIMIENGKIKELSKSLGNINYNRSIDVSGKYILPGLIDPHVHYGVYTPIEEAARTESKSAALGGVTTMIRMLRLYSDYQNNIKKQIDASLKNHIIDFSIHPSILIKQHLQDISYLIHETGINSFKVYMNLGSKLNQIHMDLNPMEKEIRSGTVEISDDFLNKIVKITSQFNTMLLVHAEDPKICYNEIKREIIDKKDNNHHHHHNLSSSSSSSSSSKSNGKASLVINHPLTITPLGIKNTDYNKGHKSEQNLLKLWSQCRPIHSEIKSIQKIAELGRKYNSNIYFVHIGSSAAIDAIIKEKEKGRCNLYIETCPHYLTHTHDFNDLKGKVVPPLRSKHDLQSIWYALRNGIIDTVGTDHVANRLSLKLDPNGDLLESLSGFPGIATMLPVLLSEGVNKGRINLQRVSEVTSYNTSRIFGLYPQKGAIQKGSDADLVIVDLDLKKRVTPELLQSYSDYTSPTRRAFCGGPIATILRGKVVMENYIVDENAYGYGKFVHRFKN
ncbi:MAG: dihydroorotase family protein [Nitrososphaeraceae archaeon]|nr:dihydroorotase family protein [Nitrososphaeraceae archaeon]